MNKVASTLLVDFQQPYSDTLERVGRFCLRPVHILFGESYTIKIQNHRIEEATLHTWNKVHRLAVFLFSVVLFPLFLGCTALGVIATLSSKSHKVGFRLFKGCLDGERRNLTLLERIEMGKKASLMTDLAEWKEKLKISLTEHEKNAIQQALLHHLETSSLSYLSAKETLELFQLCYLYDVVSPKALNLKLAQMDLIRAHVESLEASGGAYHLATVATLAQLGANARANLSLLKRFSHGQENALMSTVWDFVVAPTTKERIGNRFSIVATLWMYDHFDAFERHFPTWSLADPHLVEELLAQAEGKQLDWLLRSRPELSTHPIWERVRGEHLEKLFSLTPEELFPLFVGHKSQEANHLLFTKFREHGRLHEILTLFKAMDWRAHWGYIALHEKLIFLGEESESRVLAIFYAGLHDTIGKELGAGWETWNELEHLFLALREKDIPFAVKGALRALKDKKLIDEPSVEQHLLSRIDLRKAVSPDARRALLHQLHEIVASQRAKDR